MNRPAAALAGAVALALVCPMLLLPNRASRPMPAGTDVPAPIAPSPPGRLDTALQRGLFSAPAPSIGEATVAADDDAAPVVVGIVGRLPDQAVALVLRTGGGTRTMSMGESVAGWRLDSIAPDAALFVRGDRRVRVDVTAGPAGAAQ